MKTLGPRLAPADLRRAHPPAKTAEPFYLSPEWRGFVGQLIRGRGRRCEECGRGDCRIFGDHIVELRDGGALLDGRNVQLLCGSCHTTKTVEARATRLASK